MWIEFDSLWHYLLAAAFVLTVGLVSGRILGVRRGFLRATFAGIFGSLVGLVLAAVVFVNDTTINVDDIDAGDFLLTTFGFALLATMITSIVLEVLLRPRRRTKRGSLRTRIRSFLTIGGRLFEVTRIARRHGLAGPRLASKAAWSSPETGLRIKLFLQDCGGVFIKFGQIASTRGDLLPAPLVEQLADLQSNVTPVPTDAIRRTVEAELKAPVSDVFVEFSDEPLAAASIGQTHLAELRGGDEVVVKIRRPDVEVGVARDSAVLRWASRAAVRRSEAARSLGLVAVADELVRSVEKELDYVHEAANARILAAASEDAAVQVPTVRTSFSTDAVLVMDRIHGRPVSDRVAVDACAVPRSELANRLLRTFLDHVLRHGVFHADPHPGNILVDAEGTLWLIDCGAIGVIDPVSMEALRLMGAGMVSRQPAILVRALRVVSGSAADELDPSALEAELSRVLGEQLRGGGFDPGSLQQILDIMRRHELPVPPTFTLLARALITLEGTLRVIDPQFDVAGAATGELGASMELAPGGAQDLLQKELLRSLPSLRTLPGLAEDLGIQARSGRLRLQVDAFSGLGQTHVTRWLDQTLFTVVAGVGLLVSAVMLVGAAIAEAGRGTATLSAVGYFGLVISSVMLMRVVAQILRRAPDLGE